MKNKRSELNLPASKKDIEWAKYMGVYEEGKKQTRYSILESISEKRILMKMICEGVKEKNV